MKSIWFGCQSAKLSLLLILFYLFALGPGSTSWAGASSANNNRGGDVIASAKYQASNGLHVRGRYLLSGNDVNLIMRGVNHMHTWFLDRTSAIQHIKAKGANTVRVVLSSGDVPGWSKNSASDVAQVIQLCKANKLICVLEVHDTTGYGESSDAISLAQAVNYWKEIKSVLIGQEAYVIINIGNEPYGNVNTSGWVNDTKNAIVSLRNAGFTHLLMVDAPSWGQDWEFVMRDNAASIFNSDPLRNTVFSIHMYGVFETAASIQNYLSFFVSANLPLVIGEFGHFHTDGNPDEDTIMATAETYGIGYMGWAWSGNCCGGEYLDMVTDFDPSQETSWGTRIFHGSNGIDSTSVEASIYSGDRNPIVSNIKAVKPNPTSAISVKFAVTFSESVTGVDTGAPFSDFQLSTSGVTGAAITSITGSGTTRTVTVNTGSGNGTIRLDVLDNDSIKDGNRNSLGGPGAGNGNYITGETFTITKPTNIDVSLAGNLQAQFFVAAGQSTRRSLAGINAGPVKIASTQLNPMISAERVIYKVNGVNTSFSEMMGLPAGQLDTIYWLPWYNNVSLDTQLRIANVSNATATVQISIGGTPVAGGPYTLAPGASIRKSFAGIDKGPVRIQSNVNIVAAARVLYKGSGGVDTSFSEIMALPNKQLDTLYWLPWYNNVSLDTQLRIANVSSSTVTVSVNIGGMPMSGSPYTLTPGASIRKSYAGIDKGPVKIQSTGNIVVSERVIHKANGVPVSFSEMMGMPNSQLDTVSWLPWYNNVGLDTQLRIANVSGSTATVHVTIGGVTMPGSPYTLTPGASIRKSFAGIDKGSVRVESSGDMVISERVIYKVNGLDTSFSEMMAVPNKQLDALYWLPWYNNVGLDTQLRLALP